MNKIKKFGLSALVLIIALFFVVSAQAGAQKATLINSSGNKVVVGVGSTAAGFYFGHGYVLMTTNNVYAKPQELGALTSPDISSRYLCINGDCTFYVTGSFQDATTTIVSFPDPFTKATSTAGDVVLGMYNDGAGYTGATSTVDLVRLDITGAATSTYSVSCGASAGWSTADTVSLLDTATNGVATSSTGILENNLTAALGGLADAGTVHKITLNPQYPWFTCRITSTYTGAFTEATNAFVGKWAVHVSKTR